MAEKLKCTPVGADMAPTRLGPSGALLDKARGLGNRLRQKHGMNSSCGFGRQTQAVSHPSIERITSPLFDEMERNYEHPHASFLRAQDVGSEEDEMFIRGAHARRIHRRIGRFPNADEREKMGFKVLDEEYDPALPSPDDLPRGFY